MLLSVVVPTFNRRDSLRITLNGLARQQFPAENFEVVVVSDGSRDGTDEMLAEVARQTKFVLRPIAQENAGPSRARNRGMREAQGQVVVFLDDDVEPGQDFLAVHAAYHEQSDCIAVIGPMLPDSALHRKEPCWIAWEHAMLEKQYRAWRTGEWQGVGPNHFYSGNTSVRREHLLAVGGFDETFKRQEDVELAYRLERERGIHFAFDAKAVGTHRPQRTFTSWKKVPFAYGSLDVERAKRGDLDWETVCNAYRYRSRVTRACFQLCYVAPPLSNSLRAILFGVARLTWKLRQERVSLAALSVLYNVLYLEGVAEGLNNRDQLQKLLNQEIFPNNSKV